MKKEKYNKKKRSIIRCAISGKIINKSKEAILTEFAGLWVEKQGNKVIKLVCAFMFFMLFLTLSMSYVYSLESSTIPVLKQGLTSELFINLSIANETYLNDTFLRLDGGNSPTNTIDFDDNGLLNVGGADFTGDITLDEGADFLAGINWRYGGGGLFSEIIAEDQNFLWFNTLGNITLSPKHLLNVTSDIAVNGNILGDRWSLPASKGLCSVTSTTICFLKFGDISFNFTRGIPMARKGSYTSHSIRYDIVSATGFLPRARFRAYKYNNGTLTLMVSQPLTGTSKGSYVQTATTTRDFNSNLKFNQGDQILFTLERQVGTSITLNNTIITFDVYYDN